MNSHRRIREKRRLSRRLREWRYAKVKAIIGFDPRTYRSDALREARKHLRMFSESVDGLASAWERAAIEIKDTLHMAAEEVARHAGRVLIETAISQGNPK